MERIPVWIDCDPGVDDAAALLLAGRMPELELVGLSAVAGNVCLAQACSNLLKLREQMGAKAPVYAGAPGPLHRPAIDAVAFHGRDGLGGVALPEAKGRAEETPAWDGLYQAARRRPGGLTLIALGPLTNVAVAFRRYPDLPRLLRRLLLMGGAIRGGNRTPFAEFNILADPEAAALVFAAELPVVMFGLDVTLQAYMTPDQWRELAKGSETVRLLAAMQQAAMTRVMAQGAPGIAMHDPCPVLYAADPSLFEGASASIQVATDGPQLGRTLARWSESGNCRVMLQVDRSAFLDRVFQILGRYSGAAPAFSGRMPVAF